MREVVRKGREGIKGEVKVIVIAKEQHTSSTRHASTTLIIVP